ncbi:hypothetical protein BmR1_04g06550 [Babesia microti strain RI]|uniref:J domain-containing protein n=1 Tax=Babesia microti (strain RI) TaxID=1133968 RepID=I7IHB2_BABMR|nr:hypothetical protein BmR1_04g06550 [Babesia microti strain RI]CCF75507.1 hypothetical protein BmR1_04g06550 [Babesia microti strain RI]|eukprot:XP_012649915.1 hypothetical protein BmR1_04g06550 [Babesia microti strain RI]
MGVDDLPSILSKVDLLTIFGLTVNDVSDDNGLSVLRQKFLYKAKQCHPDKQTPNTASKSNEFAILKAAYDHLIKDNNLEKYVANRRSYSENFTYEHVDTVISAKQAYLKAQLDKRIKEFKRKYTKDSKPAMSKFDDNSMLMNYYSDILKTKAEDTCTSTDNTFGKIHVIVTATDKIKEISLLVKSNHFLELFNGFGIVSICLMPNYSYDKPEIAKIIFNSNSNAILALLYYRQHKSLFRNDLYSLAFISDAEDTESHNKTNTSTSDKHNISVDTTNAKRSISVKDLQGSILEKFKKRATTNR